MAKKKTKLKPLFPDGEPNAINRKGMVERARARIEEYLNGLLIIVGSRGHDGYHMWAAFAHSADPKFTQMLEKFNTPEARRNLHTILKALQVVPTNWAGSAFTRFMRNTGAQKNSTHYGCGLLGKDYGWKPKETEVVCQMVMGRSSNYAKVFADYKDVLGDAMKAGKDDAVDSVTLEYIATSSNRDKEFLEKLCGMLEKRGLGPIPEAAVKPERTAKEFKPGDKITERNLRDLPLPAAVDIPIQRKNRRGGKWFDTTLKVVVTKVQRSKFHAYLIGNDGTAFEPMGTMGWHKPYLFGAVYQGPWEGTVDPDFHLVTKFSLKRPGEK